MRSIDCGPLVAVRGQGGPEEEVRKGFAIYRGILLIRNSASLGLHSRTMPRALWCSQGGVRFLMREVPLDYVQPPSQTTLVNRTRHMALLWHYGDPAIASRVELAEGVPRS